MTLTKRILIVMSFLMVATLYSCKEKDPSIFKVYIRSSDYILTEGASVRIVGDISKGTPEYFDEKKSNESGAAVFNLDDLFDKYDKDDEKVAYFNIYARDTAQYFTIRKGRAKANLTSTATIVLEN